VKTVRVAAVACALALAAACGSGPYSDAAEAIEAPPSVSETSRDSDGSPARRLNRQALGNGLVLTISPPMPFTPTDNAYPKTPRAVAFEMTIDNEGVTAYRPSQLSVTATGDGAAIAQVIDSTQGYPGLDGSTDTVPPGHSTRFSIAFAVPADQVVLRVAVHPDASTDDTVVVYEGGV
jgi:hypothetical protein